MSQCACVRLKKKPVINEDEELSDSSKSDIAMATTPCLKPKPKPKRRLSFKIGDLRRIVPDRILQCFGQDEIEMTKLEKSKFETKVFAKSTQLIAYEPSEKRLYRLGL